MAEVASGLNLFLKLKNPADMPRLNGLLVTLQPRIRQALNNLHYVHFARFVATPDQSMLLVITEFDGELRNYVMDFAAVVGDEFTQILSFMVDAPPLPVQEHPREFWEFIDRHSTPRVPVWSAYPDKTVLDILGPRRARPLSYVDAKPAEVDLKDVQGNILRGYTASCAHHFLLGVTDAAAAGAFIEQLVHGTGPTRLRLSTAEEWPAGVPKPESFVNLGFTHLGLQALGVPADTLRLFPESFRMGPAAADRAPQNGDVGDSAPRHWDFGAMHTPQVHAMLSLYARDAGWLKHKVAELEKLLPAHGLQLVYQRRTQALPDGRVHFGYKDGISQPHIACEGTRSRRPDMQPAAHAGDFLLGHANHAGGDFLDRLPAELCSNGTYAAVRMMRQDVVGFHRLLADVARRHALDPDLVAAKLMGRWPGGAPLSLYPHKDPGPLAPEQLNRFDYAPTDNHPATHDDADGLRCPVSAHARRMNPRGSLVTGKPYSRRIIRRGMPYGPAYDPAAPAGLDSNRNGIDDRNEERGLFGLFICGDLEHQFEFLLRVWANSDLAAAGQRRTQDPILGTQSLDGGFSFQVPGQPRPVEMTVPRLVHTTGSVYLFMPGIAGLEHLAGLARGVQAAGPVAPLPAPAVPAARTPPQRKPPPLDPHSEVFLENPYPAYARYRDAAPVHFVEGRHQSYWVFSYELVHEMLKDENKHVFVKNRFEPLLDNNPADLVHNIPNGLFFMDPPRHDQVRRRLDPLFAKAIEGIGPKLRDAARERIAALRPRRTMDLIQDYVRPIAQQAFMTIFGIPLTHQQVLANWVIAALAGNNKAADLQQRGNALTARFAMGGYFQAMRQGIGCPLGQPDLLSQMRTHADAQVTLDRHDLDPVEFQQTATHFALGGYLSTEFLLATGILNLLQHPQQLERLRVTPGLLPGAVQEMLRYDAPFQLTDRYADKDVELGGVLLRKGAKITMVFGSANRDPKVFGEPDRFDITRVLDSTRPHFSLGGGGHRCIGAPLVDIVAPIAVWELISGLPDLALTDGRQWQKDPYFRSLSLFPLRW
jgi:cytochrome P450/deferrochelatase/peroxidase EfeB